MFVRRLAQLVNAPAATATATSATALPRIAASGIASAGPGGYAGNGST